MNTAERIVEAYFRHCLDCFTMSDVKVEAGNNRQLDLVAIHLPTSEAYHVETTVKIAGFCPTLEKLRTAFEHKFFGAHVLTQSQQATMLLAKTIDLLSIAPTSGLA